MFTVVLQPDRASIDAARAMIPLIGSSPVVETCREYPSARLVTQGPVQRWALRAREDGVVVKALARRN
jgi:hypothetical protein